MPQTVGGFGVEKEADDKVREVVGKVEVEIRSKLVEQIGAVSQSIEPLAYRTQIVAGTNYFVKLLIDQFEIFHARLYRNLQGDVTLLSVTERKTRDEEIEYF
ncbi:unnamed protein product [Allacma fusca]|uniref:Cystatin domain-containing protein n=1 Tax=Allacma fusca TaxID=39272 RepID=A0A8J2KUC5_9HEXA|nr:unnamed protein product [Allacma fusca]